MRQTLLAATALLVLGSPLRAHDLPMQYFRADSLAQITDIRSGRAFIMFFWAADCSVCTEQLALLRDLSRMTPRVPLIIVSTDGAAARSAGHVLEEYGLDKEDLWTFEVAGSAAIRKSIDPKWDGKLPRTYLYDASHARQGITGRLDRGQLDGWVRQVNAMH
ncbi:MAG: conjugal transfer protein TraF [Gammaproteobacteria bacterium]|nr:conjugal transfer protein TraF [Gammaproteobacteria bacterium]